MTSPPSDPGIPRELAHELRSPLAALVAAIDLVTDPAAPLDAEEATELLRAARADAVHLLAVVERARLPAERLPAEPVVLSDVVRRSLDRFPGLSRRITFTPDRDVIAAADGPAVDQIVTNLLQNVSRYAPAGRVDLRLTRDGAVVVLECSDEGPGIPPDERESVFGSGRSAGGLHVGLMTSRDLARRMGGDLTVVDGPTAGATLRLVLPADQGRAGVDVGRAVGPRVRLLLDIAQALEAGSARETAALIARLAAAVLDITHVRVLVERPEGLVALDDPAATPLPRDALPALAPGTVAPLPPDLSWPPIDGDHCRHRNIVPVPGGRHRAWLLACTETELAPAGDDPVLDAVALVAGLAVARLGAEQERDTERSLRATVMEALPIAISIFEGDPPRLVDWNAAELELLGLADPALRPTDLDASQQAFDIRFADGRPLTAENAPVVTAIRAGRRSGPFELRIRRLDGSEVRTRTYCSPILVGGVVTGAVVTSERLDEG